MAGVLNMLPQNRALVGPTQLSTKCPSSISFLSFRIDINGRSPSLRWKALGEELKCQGRYSCFFTDGNKQEQARKALESALGGKKTEFEKWNKEIQKREEKAGGGAAGRGGWFGGGGGWLGGFGGEHFWNEAQQSSLAIIGIISLYLLILKGHVLFAVVSNLMLFLLRGVRDGFMLLSARLSGRTSLPPLKEEAFQPQLSAKEQVVRKWGMD